MWKGCEYLQKSKIVFIIQTENEIIVNESINLFNLSDFLPRLSHPLSLKLLDVKGFDIESRIDIKAINTFTFYSKFDLYKQNRIVKSCLEFVNSSSRRGFILFDREGRNFPLSIYIHKPKINYPICPLFFQKAVIFWLIFSHLAKSYFLNNMLTFSDPIDKQQQADLVGLNSNIQNFGIIDSYGLDIDSTVLNAQVFATTQVFKFGYHINSIERDVFRPFAKLNKLFFKPFYLIELVRKQGIEWIKAINSDVNVATQPITRIAHRVVYIYFIFDRNFYLNSRAHFANDADFCLFADFPFKQLVYISDQSEFSNTKKIREQYSCSESWLYQVQQNRSFQESKNWCDFERRHRICNKSNFVEKNIPSTTTSLGRFSIFSSALNSR